MLNVGMVGLGFMAATHLKAYRHVPQARIAALCNPSGRHLDGDFSNVAGNIGTAESLKLDMSGIKTYRQCRDLLADPNLDLIDICAPTSAHPELAMSALLAGKHVLCEKPLARTSALAREIAAAAARSKSFFMPAMCVRFWPDWAWLKNAIQHQRYGRVLAARFRRVAEPPAWGHAHFHDGTKSGGALLDLHIHDVDFIHHCFGRPQRLFSTGYTKFSGAIDHVVTQYEFSSGAMVEAEGSWAMAPGFGFNMSYTVNFEKATADYDLSRGANALRVVENGQVPVTLKCDGEDGFVQELRYFTGCILARTAPEIVTAHDAVAAIEICEAEEASIRARQPVTL